MEVSNKQSVYVLSNKGEPLMPCHPALARKLLRKGKAKVKHREPFTIKLLYDTDPYTKQCTLGIDSGSSIIGAAVYCEGKILYASETEVRNDIKQKMEQRSENRRNRRNQKTRYRKKRFDNRRNSKKEDRYPPTVISKVHAHEKVIKEATSLLPIGEIVIEGGSFDMHLMQNSDLADQYKKIRGYQQGPQYGYENTKAFILARDGHKCQHCKGQSRDSRLEVHHVIFRSMGGTDIPTNLITLCSTCHKALHRGEFAIKPSNKKLSGLAAASQMNVISSVLFKRYPDAIETYGHITKANRMALDLPKEHYIDACVIASGGKAFELVTDRLIKHKCVPKGDRKLRKGKRSEIVMPTGKVRGFRKFDKVKYLGKTYFVRGRRTVGTCDLMDIDGKVGSFAHMPQGMKTPKLSNCQRIGARKSWLTDTARIQAAT